MIKHPLGIVGVLLLIEIMILYLSGHPHYKRFFKFLPAVFWIYFLPMVTSTMGFIDSQASVYGVISKNFLPASLFLLLLCVDVKAIFKLGPSALAMMLAGSFGIMLGTVVVFVLFKDVVGTQMWSGFGALSGSWTGGSANMIAVKEALGTPDQVFLPMVIVDTIVPYIWMGTLVALVGLQPIYDRWNRCDRQVLEDLTRRIKGMMSVRKEKNHFFVTIFILIFAFLGGFAATSAARLLPEVKDVISMYAWTIILVSVLGLLFSFTPARRLEEYGSTRIGYFLLYFVLTSIGAKASLAHIGSALILIVAGFLIVFIHLAVLIGVARLIRAPLFLVAVASQANIGGVASAPIVAEVYQPGLASVGLLLAILGGIIGTYLGLLVGQICHLIAG
ncbi:MAG TPA: DUF819 family protein [Candidatus Omnitrophota bacterium]|nr:DUF819 family protein [Candidatus Omnitrophota bacterium]